MKIAITENIANAAIKMDKTKESVGLDGTRDPKMVNKDVPISVQELNEETRPTKRPFPGYIGFVRCD